MLRQIFYHLNSRFPDGDGIVFEVVNNVDMPDPVFRHDAKSWSKSGAIFTHLGEYRLGIHVLLSG